MSGSGKPSTKTAEFRVPGLGEGGGRLGGFDVTAIDDNDNGADVSFDGVVGVGWSSSGTFSNIILAFSSWTRLKENDKMCFLG